MGVGRSTTNALLGPPSKGVGGAGTPGREEGGRSANGHSATHQAAWVVGVNHGSGGAAVVAWLREDRKQQEAAGTGKAGDAAEQKRAGNGARRQEKASGQVRTAWGRLSWGCFLLVGNAVWYSWNVPPNKTGTTKAQRSIAERVHKPTSIHGVCTPEKRRPSL